MQRQHDLFAKCAQFVSGSRTLSPEEFALAADVFGTVSPPINAGPWIQANGQKYLQFSTNNYLGLATDPAICAAAAEAARQYGIGCPMGSRLLSGNTQQHLELEEQVATFKGREAAVVFPAGAMATMGALSCLARRGDLLLMDQYAHASLVCGAKISGADIAYFPHNDMDRLESLLRGNAGKQAMAVVVDGVYSMQGDLGCLRNWWP